MNTSKDIILEHLSRPAFRLVGEVADDLNRECYVVGGYVRDIFLERQSKDIDFVTVGSGIEVARAVASKIGRNKSHLSVFKTYGTAQVKALGMELEFVGARRESYNRNSRNPIVKPSDMNGLKIRTVVSVTQQETWKAFGALPMAIDMTETFTALQQGTVDAQENTLAQIVTTKMYEVQKYLSLTGHAYTPMPFGISRQTWEQLDDEQKAAVKKASEEARDYQRSLDDISDRENVQFFKDHGIVVEENPDKAAFAALSGPVYDIFIKQVGTDKYFNMVRDFVAGLRK